MFRNKKVANEALKILKFFPKGLISAKGEVIVEPTANEYFLTDDCKTEKDIKAKTLQWLSRGACKAEPYLTPRANHKFHEYMQRGINDYLGTSFTQEDFEKIYKCLGGKANPEKTMEFIESGYDMNILESKEEKERREMI